MPRSTIPHPQSKLNKILRTFRKAFSRAKTPRQKIKALQNASQRKVPQWRKYAHARRKKYQRNRPKLTGICQVCGEQSHVFHHIVMLSKGGTNDRRNLIEVCDYCHCEIHPWMVDLIEPIMPEGAEQHLRDIMLE